MMKLSNELNSITDINTNGIYERQGGRVYDFYLNDVIQSSKDYVSWNQIIRGAGELDVIYLHINCYGGDVMTTIQLLRSMSECRGTIIASVEGACMSAATFLFLSADVCEVSDHSQFLIHNYSAGNWGKGNELIAKAIAEHAWANNLLHNLYAGFLTKEEIDEVINGKDFWLDSKEVVKRLQKRNDAQEKSKRKPRTRKTNKEG